MIVFWFADDRASNCYQETVRKDITLRFLNPSNVKVLENLKTIMSLLKGTIKIRFKLKGKPMKAVSYTHLTLPTKLEV